MESLFLELSVHLCSDLLKKCRRTRPLHMDCHVTTRLLCSSLSVLTQPSLEKHHLNMLSNTVKWVLALQSSCDSDTCGGGREQD